MSYEKNFYNQYRQLSNPGSQYYQRAYSNLKNTLNASSPTTNSLLGIQMAMGGSYKGSLASANQQRKAIEARNNETAIQGNNQLFVNSQGMANQALQGAQGAYEYEDSQPGFWDYIAAPLATVAGSAAPGIGTAIGGMLQGIATSGTDMKGGGASTKGDYSTLNYNNYGNWG